MPKLDPIEHKRRKDATRQHYVDDKGKPLSEESKSVAVQDKRDSCDINRIVKKVIDANGNVNVNSMSGLVKQGIFGDFTNAVDYQEVQNRVIRMNDQFMQLHPDIRQKFKNSPAQLIRYLEDPKNEKEAIDLGILPKPVFKHIKEETPEGNFWVTTKNGVEIKREPITAAPNTPGA